MNEILSTMAPIDYAKFNNILFYDYVGRDFFVICVREREKKEEKNMYNSLMHLAFSQCKSIDRRDEEQKKTTMF